MTDAQQREAARQFYYKWNGKGKEDEDARSYWIDILVNIFGMEQTPKTENAPEMVIPVLNLHTDMILGDRILGGYYDEE